MLKIMNHLAKFTELNEALIQARITAKEYVKKFNNLWKKDSLEPINRREWDVLKNLFWSVEAFEPDDKIRSDCLHCIDSKELVKDVKKYQEKMVQFIKKKSEP